MNSADYQRIQHNKVSKPNNYQARSLGFWCYNSSGVLGFVTAPHASIIIGQPIYYNGTLAGTAQTPYFAGSVDAVFIKRTNQDVLATRYVANSGFSLASSLYISLPVNSQTYSSGISSGYQSGVVQDVYLTTADGITNCVLSTATCAQGDSGGPVAGGATQVLGICLG